MLSIYSSLILWLYKNWLPDFVGVTVIISVLDINEMFGRIDDTRKFDKGAVESICILSTYVTHCYQLNTF